jgi:SAM-dependent methyltransferase
MDFRDYKSFWNDKAATPTGARIAVDGSTDERTLRLTGAFSAAQARAALDLQPTDHVFELGCGVGRIGRELAGDVARWHGLDISENMLGVARERLHGIGDARFDALAGPRLPMLADASMDKGYCVAVFIHMDKEDMVLYLRDVARVLRPGGLFYFDHWNLAHPVGWKRFAAEVDQAARLPPGQRKDVARNQFCVPEELVAYVRGAGLEPLLVIGDSPNAQVVARRPDGDDVAAARERTRLRAAAPRIDYGADWTRYFEAILEAEVAGQAPHRLMAMLDAQPADDPTAEMFRAWIGGLWRLRVDVWGPPPPSLSVPPERIEPLSKE